MTNTMTPDEMKKRSAALLAEMNAIRATDSEPSAEMVAEFRELNATIATARKASERSGVQVAPLCDQ